MTEVSTTTRIVGKRADTPALVDTEWALAHLSDPGVRFVDVEFDHSQYEQGHLPGAVGWAWQGDLVDDLRRDVVDVEALAVLLDRSGIEESTHVVLYGDDNWFASTALWQLKAHGLVHLSLLDGGRGYWRERGLPYVSSSVSAPRGRLDLRSFDPTARMTLEELRRRLADPGLTIVDVRTREEFVGEVTAPADYPPTALRAGRVPGALWAPWEGVLAVDGRFRPLTELRAHFTSLGIQKDREVVTYCGVGVRASHTWFVLHELLGFERVRNYDGSWAEWGSVIGVPIETGPARPRRS